LGGLLGLLEVGGEIVGVANYFSGVGLFHHG
jgi:hypothetical protein